MLRLRNRTRASGIERGGELKTAGNLAREIGQNIAEHVRRDDHIEGAGVMHEQRCHRINDALLVGDIGKARGHRPHAFEE